MQDLILYCDHRYNGGATIPVTIPGKREPLPHHEYYDLTSLIAFQYKWERKYPFPTNSDIITTLCAVTFGF